MVLGLLLALVSAVLTSSTRAFTTAKNARAQAELATLAAALENYRRVYGDYPRTGEPVELRAALLGTRNPEGATIVGKAFIEVDKFSVDASGALVDPWGQAYRYTYREPMATWRNLQFVLYSIGPDGADVSDLLPGGFVDQSSPAVSDNLFADLP